MNEEKREIRTGNGGMYQPHMREAAEGQTGRTIEGYAVVFGVESRLMLDYWDNYREIIEPGAITQEDLDGWDVRMTMWHNREKLLARSNKGQGTLRLTVDDKGVKYSFEAPDTADGQNALELVKRGDLSGSSFTYWTNESDNVSYEKDETGTVLRHVRKVDMIVEMTIASNPAYNETSVTARELEAAGMLPRKEDGAKEIQRVRDLSKQHLFT